MSKKFNFAANGLYQQTEESSSLSSGTPKNSILAPLGAILLSANTGAVKNAVSFKQYRQLCMANKPILYKLPKIIKPKSGDWYVQYYFRDPATFKYEEFRERKGVNYIKNLGEKQIFIDELAGQVAGWLKAGHSPYDEEQILVAQIEPKLEEIKKIKTGKTAWTLSRAVTEYTTFIEGNGHTPDTLRTYKKYVKAFESWLVENEYLDHIASEFTEIEVEVFLTDYYESEEWSGRTYNNYMEFMITFFTRIKKLEKKATKNRKLIYDFDPEELEPKITKPQRNKAFTPVMLHSLKQHLKDLEYDDLKDYLEWIFLSSMRPAEIRELRVGDIDDISRQIRFNGKTGDRLIPVSDQLMRLIHRRRVLGHGINDYVFGYAGNVDSRRMSVEYFLIRFDVIAKIMGLDENYGPYSLKPTGVISMIMAGFKDEEIMQNTGHKTVEAFRAYKRDLVIENTHVMKGSTIEF